MKLSVCDDLADIHFVVLLVKQKRGWGNPKFGILVVDHGLNRFFSLYKGRPVEYKPEQIEKVRFVEEFEFGKSGAKYFFWESIFYGRIP